MNKHSSVPYVLLIDIEDKLIDLDENDLLHLILELIKKYPQIKKFIVKW